MLDQFTQISSPRQDVIRDSSSWVAAWHDIYLPGFRPLPPVDFNTTTVLFAAMGERPTSAYDIFIDSVVSHEQGVAVYITERSEPGCSAYQTFVDPVHVVAAPFRSSVWDWRTTFLTHTC